MNARLLCEIGFWTMFACVLYAYGLYPLLLVGLARLRPRPWQRDAGCRPSVSIVLAAHNEQVNIPRRLDELLELIDAARVDGEVIIVSDGSTDQTAEIARQRHSPLIRVIELPSNRGKAAALSQGCTAARNQIIVFADARQSWDGQTLPLLLENFADPRVGAVSGDLVLRNSSGVMAGVGFYWRFEKWLRRQESAVGSIVGVSGSISAVRRELFKPIPPGTLLDDVYWPLNVAMQGYRVVHDCRAKAYDRLPDRPRDEFRRKVRTLSGNYQLVCRLPASLLPWRNPVWAQFISHKLLRLAVPWAMLAMLTLSIILDGPIYRLALWSQLAFYLAGVVGILKGERLRLPLVSAVASFLVLNAAALAALWVFATGNAARSWKRIEYEASRTRDVGTAISPAPPR